MSRRVSDLNILSGIVPAGALGISLLLGSTAPCNASDHPTNPLPSGTGVSERLTALREVVSELGSRTIKPGERTQ
jgi:hypothetical protein